MVTFTEEILNGKLHFLRSGDPHETLKVTKDYQSNITRKLRIWSHLRKESLMENLIFCAVRRLVVDRKLSKALTEEIVNATLVCLHQKTATLRFFVKTCEGTLNPHTCTVFVIK